MQKIKVLVIDDSALICKILAEIINNQPDMEVAGVAHDPIVARELIRELNPDVLTLDIEMPKMDGLDFLERLMRLRPMPVLMISTLTEANSEPALLALELGAVDFISKTKFDMATGLESFSDEVVSKIRMSVYAKIKKSTANQSEQSVKQNLSYGTNPTNWGNKLIIVGASTGGTEAIREFLMELPPDVPGILIAQHMPESFTKPFANRLNTQCRITVVEAQGGERVLPGHAYVAPGHSHLLLKRSGGYYMTELSQSEPVNRFRPSVDVLFRSAATHAGKDALGVIMTGMGKDGAAGMLEMHRAGAYTFAQDEESCVIFGMPREAIAMGGVDEIIPLKSMAKQVLRRLAYSDKPNQLRA
ncbi:MAG TPA: chemotaxis response regulator protein-glutamate methylesterase [Nitrosomonas sp.]|nr:chemotaxis response regulator protein-glutamate methylesterase [Nitrosomonas sp.]